MEKNGFGEIYRVLGGKWKYDIIFKLSYGPKRFNQLRKSLGNVSQKVLSQCLKDLEDDGLIRKVVYQENILHTEYLLTELGYQTEDIMKVAAQWVLQYDSYKNFPTKGKPFYMPTNTYSLTYEMRLEEAKKALLDAEFIAIGIGSGYSIQSGYSYRDEDASKKYFVNEYKKGFNFVYDMISANTYPKDNNIIDYWSFWANFISRYAIDMKHSPLSESLKEIVKDKKYHIITTNSDSMLINDGFPQDKVYEMLGNYSKLQCFNSCSEELWDAKPFVEKVNEDIKNFGTIRDINIPRCPKCGEYLIPNHVKQFKGIFFVTSQYIKPKKNYTDFITSAKNKKTVFLELGCGLHLPEIIRFPFEKYTYENPNATLIRINSLDPYVTNPELKDNRVIIFKEPMAEVLDTLSKSIYK